MSYFKEQINVLNINLIKPTIFARIIDCEYSLILKMFFKEKRTMTVVSNQNKLAHNYLMALEAKKLPQSMSYLKAIYQANLDFSNASLNRIDSLLVQLKTQQKLDKHSFFDANGNKQFVFLLSIYIGEYIARIIDSPTTWYAGKDYYAGKEKLINQSNNLLIAEIITIIKPLSFLSIRLFTQKDLTLKEWINTTIANQLQEAEKLERIAEEHLEDGLEDFDNLEDLQDEYDDFQPTAINQKPTSDIDIPAFNHQNLTPHNSTETAFQKTKNSPATIEQSTNKVPDTNKTLDNGTEKNTKNIEKKNTDKHHLSAKSNQHITNQIKTKRRTKTKKTTAKTPKNTDTEIIDTRKAYAEKLDINYNGNFMARFKPPIKSRLIATVPLVIILLYQCFGVFQKYDDTGKLSIIGIVFLVIYLLILIGMWVHYALSWVNVFDNKVSKTSPFNSEIAYFDKRVRFFHVQGDGEFLGVKDHVLIKTNAESLKLSVQNHDELQDLLLTLEADMLVDKMLAKINAGDTLTFNLVKLNQQNITYGSQTQPIAALGEIDFEENFLLLYLNNGDRFAKIDMNSEPNINSMMMVLETLKADPQNLHFL